MKSFTDNAPTAIIGLLLLCLLLALLMGGLRACHLVPAHPAGAEAAAEYSDEPAATAR